MVLGFKQVEVVTFDDGCKVDVVFPTHARWGSKEHQHRMKVIIPSLQQQMSDHDAHTTITESDDDAFIAL
jgi:hypothetical protein